MLAYRLCDLWNVGLMTKCDGLFSGSARLEALRGRIIAVEDAHEAWMSSQEAAIRP